MIDMLVPLYALDANERRACQLASSLVLRRALAPERRLVVDWVEAQFGPGWAGECEAAFAATPTRCMIAIEKGVLLGFAAWDVTALGFFGPTGVGPNARGKGVGAALLREVLKAMRDAGYGYAIIGAAGAPEFFTKVAGAVAIPGSTPGFYRGLLKPGSPTTASVRR
jgi:GNAT superfamily N-acetyltransferase